MTLRRGLIGLTAATALALSGAGVLANTAHAAVSVKVSNVDAGQTARIHFTGCQDPAFTGVKVQIATAQSTVKSVDLDTKTTSYDFKTAAQGASYGVRVTCVAAAGGKNDSATAKFSAWPTRLSISPSRWHRGEKVTLTGYGYQAGETVNLKMVDKSSGKVAWTQTGVKAVNSEGKLSYTVVIKGDVPLGTYILTLTGTKSGLARSAEFYWGTPDTKPTKPVDPKPGKPADPKPGKPADPKPALPPKTGN